MCQDSGLGKEYQVTVESMLTAVFLLMSPLAWAGEARVQLFGQPCLLVGPPKYSSQILLKIHQVSPELYPPTTQLSESKKKLQQVEKTEGLPSEFGTYKAKLLRRLSAFVKINELIEAAKAKQTESLWSEVLSFFKTSERVGARAKISAYLVGVEKSRGRTSEDARQELMLDILDGLDSNPEVEFHKITEGLQIRYQCDFDAGVEN